MDLRNRPNPSPMAEPMLEQEKVHEGIKYPDVQVQLTGEDGNAFAVLGRVARAMRRAGHGDAVEAFMAEATSGDYDHLLATAMNWVDVS